MLVDIKVYQEIEGTVHFVTLQMWEMNSTSYLFALSLEKSDLFSFQVITMNFHVLINFMKCYEVTTKSCYLIFATFFAIQ